MQCSMGMSAMRETILITQEADYEMMRCNRQFPAGASQRPSVSTYTGKAHTSFFGLMACMEPAIVGIIKVWECSLN